MTHIDLSWEVLPDGRVFFATACSSCADPVPGYVTLRELEPFRLALGNLLEAATNLLRKNSPCRCSFDRELAEGKVGILARMHGDYSDLQAAVRAACGETVGISAGTSGPLSFKCTCPGSCGVHNNRARTI